MANVDPMRLCSPLLRRTLDQSSFPSLLPEDGTVYHIHRSTPVQPSQTSQSAQEPAHRRGVAIV